MAGGAFRNMNWDHVLVAGGAVLGCLLPNFRAGNGFAKSDIDLFLHGLTPDAANQKLQEVLQSVSQTTQLEDVVVSSHAVTIVGVRPHRHVQIILRLYISPLEVLSGFDIDSCCVGFDGVDIWATKRVEQRL